MPRYPLLSPATAGVYQSVFARIADRLARVRGEVFPLHIGDTYLDPFSEGLPAAEDTQALARYAHPHGRADLSALLSARLAAQGLPAGSSEVQITTGATHALFSAAVAVLDRGDEVLVLAPHWPLIPGILLTAGARPVEVPFFDRLAQDPGADAAELLRPYVTERTAAVYFNSPNNPTGKVLTRAQLETIAALARERRLWVLADEVYAGFCFGDPPPLMGALLGMAECTLSAFSLSKSHAMAGYRVGCLCGPGAVIDVARKVCTHTVYSTAGIGQWLARGVLADDGLEHAVLESYRRGAEMVGTSLRATFSPAEGGAYVFLDLREFSDPDAVLGAALDRGVALAPGEAFGPSYRGWARLCYTSVPPDRLARGIALLNDVLAAFRR
jgi:aspartate/methionine/tyrosine aminotransferase